MHRNERKKTSSFWKLIQIYLKLDWQKFENRTEILPLHRLIAVARSENFNIPLSPTVPPNESIRWFRFNI